MKAERKDSMREIHIVRDSYNGMVTLLIDGETAYECLENDEASEVIADLLEELD